MKIGLILECGPSGPDEQVFRHLARRFHPKIDLVCETLLQKPKMIAGCGKAATLLLEGGCSKIGIVWDLYPPWRDKDESEHCRGADRERIFASLAEAKVDTSKVHLVCITEELEAWLLADKRGLTGEKCGRRCPPPAPRRASPTMPPGSPDRRPTNTGPAPASRTAARSRRIARAPGWEA